MLYFNLVRCSGMRELGNAVATKTIVLDAPHVGAETSVPRIIARQNPVSCSAHTDGILNILYPQHAVPHARPQI